MNYRVVVPVGRRAGGARARRRRSSVCSPLADQGLTTPSVARSQQLELVIRVGEPQLVVAPLLRLGATSRFEQSNDLPPV